MVAFVVEADPSPLNALAIVRLVPPTSLNVMSIADVEEANDIVCGGRSQVAYEQMLLDGQADALLALDEARREARELLKTES